jgi:cell division septum initiation protein DivIVA
MILRLLKRLVELHRENRKLRATIARLEPELAQVRGNANSYMQALFAKHGQIHDLVELSEAHKAAAETYRVALEEWKGKVGA